MLNDQELIDGLRSGLERLRPRADLIEGLRERAPRRSGPKLVVARGLAGMRAGGKVALIALPVLIAVGIAVAALLLLGPRHRATASTQPIPVSPIAPAPRFLLPVGARRGAGNPFGRVIPGSARVVAQAADPHGGLPWGLRTFRTTEGRTCLQVGRLQSGMIGEIGRQGAWHNDGRFHPLALDSGPPADCVQTDGHGHAFENIRYDETTANAYTFGGSCIPGGAYGGRPACPQSILRSLGYGLLGPDAASITYRLGGELYSKPTGADGAYLIVGPPMSGGGGERFAPASCRA